MFSGSPDFSVLYSCKSRQRMTSRFFLCSWLGFPSAGFVTLPHPPPPPPPSTPTEVAWLPSTGSWSTHLHWLLGHPPALVIGPLSALVIGPPTCTGYWPTHLHWLLVHPPALAIGPPTCAGYWATHLHWLLAHYLHWLLAHPPALVIGPPICTGYWPTHLHWLPGSEGLQLDSSLLSPQSSSPSQRHVFRIHLQYDREKVFRSSLITFFR